MMKCAVVCVGVGVGGKKGKRERGKKDRGKMLCANAFVAKG
jgi:hypothetical protein